MELLAAFLHYGWLAAGSGPGLTLLAVALVLVALRGVGVIGVPWKWLLIPLGLFGLFVLGSLALWAFALAAM